jgi:hypothetical protein
VNQPLLASEMLRDEAAPLSPGAGASRIWLLGCALVLASSEIAIAGAPAMGAAVAAALVILALMPLRYVWRALLAVLAGALLLALSRTQTGPLAAQHDPLRLLAALTLPAAVWFRGYYRHYLPAHLVLGLGLVAALPYAAGQAELVAYGTSSLGTAGALAGLAAVAAALLVLVPQASGWVVAPLVLLGIALEMAGVALADGDAAAALAQAAGWVAPSSLVALGLFQVLAWLSAGRARRVLRVRPEAEDELEQRISVG